MDEHGAHLDFYLHFAARFSPMSMSITATSLMPAPYDDALHTTFEMNLGIGEADRNLPFHDALLDLSVCPEHGTDTRLFVLQMGRSLICAILEQGKDSERMSGEFISSPNLFTVDALSEIWSVAHFRTAQKIIIDKATLLLSPILSGETGELLGAELGKKMSTPFAERFADAFLPSLLENTKIKNIDSGQ